MPEGVVIESDKPIVRFCERPVRRLHEVLPALTQHARYLSQVFLNIIDVLDQIGCQDNIEAPVMERKAFGLGEDETCRCLPLACLGERGACEIESDEFKNPRAANSRSSAPPPQPSSRIRAVRGNRSRTRSKPSGGLYEPYVFAQPGYSRSTPS